MSLTQLVRTYRQRRTTIALGAGLGAVAALGSTFLMPTLFESTTQLFVTTTARTADGQIAPDAGSASDRVRSYARLATSEEVLAQVITDLKLPITTADLATRIRASNEPGTVLIDVRARDEVAANARDIAQKVGEHLPVVVQNLETPSDGNDAAVEGPEVTPAPITVRVTAKAVLAHDPVSPNRLLYLAYGLLAGSLLALLALTWQALFDRRLRSRAEVTERTGIPVLAEIPESSAPLVGFAGDDGSSAHAEAFRRLRAQLSHAPSGRSLGSAVVTSAVNGEGRTATATNLALALAYSGTDVVLVDADLRSPGVGELLGVGAGPGLSSLLTGAAPLEAALRQWRPGLSLRVITSGPAVANPGDLLSSLRMASLVTALVEHGLTVVIDSPPLTTVADASSLARLADGVLLVARCGRTTADQIGAAVDELRSLGTPLFGIALNRTPAPKGATAANATKVAPSKPRRAGRGKAKNPVEIPYGSAAGHAAEGFTETAPPPTRAAPPGSLAAAVADLLGQGSGAVAPAGPSIGEVSSPEAIAAVISATASAGNAASVLAGTAAAPTLPPAAFGPAFEAPLSAAPAAPYWAPSAVPVVEEGETPLPSRREVRRHRHVVEGLKEPARGDEGAGEQALVAELPAAVAPVEQVPNEVAPIALPMPSAALEWASPPLPLEQPEPVDVFAETEVESSTDSGIDAAASADDRIPTGEHVTWFEFPPSGQGASGSPAGAWTPITGAPLEPSVEPMPVRDLDDDAGGLTEVAEGIAEQDAGESGAGEAEEQWPVYGQNDFADYGQGYAMAEVAPAFEDATGYEGSPSADEGDLDAASGFDEMPAFQEISFEGERGDEMPPLAVSFDDLVQPGSAEFEQEQSGQGYGLAEEYAAEEPTAVPEPLAEPQREPLAEPQREPLAEPQREPEPAVAVADTNPHGLLLHPTGDANPLFHSNVAFREIPHREQSYLAPDYSGPVAEQAEHSQPEYGQSAGYGSDAGYGQYGQGAAYGRSFAERFDQTQPGALHAGQHSEVQAAPPTAPTPALAPPTLPALPQAPAFTYRYEPEVLPQPEPAPEPPVGPGVPRPSQSSESILRPPTDWGSPWNEAPRQPAAPSTPDTPQTPYTDSAYAMPGPAEGGYGELPFAEGQTTAPVENDWRDVPRYEPSAEDAEEELRPLLDPGMPLEATRAQQITPGKRRR